MSEQDLLDNKNYDYLERDSIIEDIENILSSLNWKKNNSFAINGEWGIGKTTVIEMLYEKIKNQYLVIKYNAWENDFYDDPLIPILLEIANVLNKSISNGKIVLQVLLGIPIDIIKTVADSILDSVNSAIALTTGVNLKKIGNNFRNTFTNRVNKSKRKYGIDTSFDIEEQYKAILKNIKAALLNITKEIKFIFIIDELDRCLPEFSIKTLERLHHIFESLPNTCIIISIAKKQLNQTINKIFGNEIDLDRYLNKFIDFVYPLDVGDTSIAGNKYIEYLENIVYDNNDNNDKCNLEVKELISKIIFNDIDIRSLNTIQNNLELAIRVGSFKEMDRSIFFYIIIYSIIDYKKIGTKKINDFNRSGYYFALESFNILHKEISQDVHIGNNQNQTKYLQLLKENLKSYISAYLYNDLYPKINCRHENIKKNIQIINEFKKIYEKFKIKEQN